MLLSRALPAGRLPAAFSQGRLRAVCRFGALVRHARHDRSNGQLVLRIARASRDGVPAARVAGGRSVSRCRRQRRELHDPRIGGGRRKVDCRRTGDLPGGFRTTCYLRTAPRWVREPLSQVMSGPKNPGRSPVPSTFGGRQSDGVPSLGAKSVRLKPGLQVGSPVSLQADACFRSKRGNLSGRTGRATPLNRVQ